MPKFTHIIKCHICATPVGTLELESKYRWVQNELSDDALGIADNRCPSCEAAHGNFKAIVQDLTAFFKDADKAEAFAKDFRKLSLIADEIAKEPLFKDFDGTFTNNAFNNALKKAQPTI